MFLFVYLDKFIVEKDKSVIQFYKNLTQIFPNILPITQNNNTLDFYIISPNRYNWNYKIDYSKDISNNSNQNKIMTNYTSLFQNLGFKDTPDNILEIFELFIYVNLKLIF